MEFIKRNIKARRRARYQKSLPNWGKLWSDYLNMTVIENNADEVDFFFKCVKEVEADYGHKASLLFAAEYP